MCIQIVRFSRGAVLEAGVIIFLSCYSCCSHFNHNSGNEFFQSISSLSDPVPQIRYNQNKKKILNMYDGFDYVEKCRNLIFMGPTGTGKTGLATAFLTHAIDRGYNGRFIAFAELVEQLYQSVADHTEAHVIKKFAATDCLLIDELGYVEVEPVQVGLFFTLMSRRHQKKTTLITSNLGFSQWSSFLKNDHLTAALIDRLTENSHVINMRNCVSLRSKLGTI
ncbi:ATP-binding protein [uncultured Desulfobacter sp.]|uniref:ATP-binding protein n=1 Tax=uncultured Desulfobacter sp. TaxID=240139 RepID=UPI002AA698D7|nr:ATP-binding protein [uncultured Desulfobacter sp.]